MAKGVKPLHKPLPGMEQVKPALKLSVKVKVADQPDNVVKIGGKYFDLNQVGQYVRVAGPVDRKTCPICFPFVGNIYPKTEPSVQMFKAGNGGAHPRCRHYLVPVGMPGIDRAYKSGQAGAGEAQNFKGDVQINQWIQEGDTANLSRLYGKTKADLLVSGEITLRDLYRDDNTPKNLAELGYDTVRQARKAARRSAETGTNVLKAQETAGKEAQKAVSQQMNIAGEAEGEAKAKGVELGRKITKKDVIAMMAAQTALLQEAKEPEDVKDIASIGSREALKPIQPTELSKEQIAALATDKEELTLADLIELANKAKVAGDDKTYQRILGIIRQVMEKRKAK